MLTSQACRLVPGSTAYCSVIDTHGGVARNIAQGLGQLGFEPGLATALGQDAAGQQVLERLHLSVVRLQGALPLG